MRRSAGLVLALVATALAFAPTAPSRPSGPLLRFGPDVPADVRSLATATWERFAAAFPARRGCMSSLTLEHAWRLPDRAAYHPPTRRIVLRVPATAATLRATLIHELAHHLEFTCAEHRSLRRSFLAAHDLPADAPWRDGAAWEDVPSERFAEAVTVHVLERAPSHLRVPVPAEAVDVIERWARGAALG